MNLNLCGKNTLRFIKILSVCILIEKRQACHLDNYWMNAVEIQCKPYATGGSSVLITFQCPTAGNDSTAVDQTCEV